MSQILLLAAGFLVLVAVSATSVILVDQAREDSGWVVHTVEVENQISTLLLEIRRAESGARGYLLTSEPRFLAEYDAAVAGCSRRCRDRLSKRASDNPVQIENNKRLRPAILARLAELEKIIDLVKRNDARRVLPGAAAARPGPMIRLRASIKSPTRCGRKRTSCSCCAPRRRTAPSGSPRS